MSDKNEVSSELESTIKSLCKTIQWMSDNDRQYLADVVKATALLVESTKGILF